MKTWLRCVRRALPSKWTVIRGAQGLFLLAALCAATAHANTITVDNASSGSVAGACSLQDAVAAANTNAAVNGCSAGTAGADTIVFAPAITSITLDAPMTNANVACAFGLAVTEDLTIDGGAVAGSGVPKVTIQRSGAAGTPSFGVIGASLYNCGTNPTVQLTLTLAGLTIANGSGNTVQGGIAASGGGVAADILTVRDSIVTGNLATNGGGIYAFSSLTMSSSTVSNNSAPNAGGIESAGAMSISSSTISGNSTTGIYGPGPLTIDNSTISGNSGPGIDSSSIAAYFVTITANTGSGINLQLSSINNAVAEFDDTAIVGNGLPSAPNVHDLDTSASRPITGTFNYIGTLNAVALSDLDVGVRIAPCASVNLGPLANNGGGTATHALLAGSCLIDAGGTVSPGGFLFAHDQRGGGFPRFVNTRADIGAYESQGGPAPVNGICGSDNGQTLLVAPVNLCSSGSASAVAGSGHPWSWTCSGSGGGGNASCSATIKTWTVTAAVTGAGGSVAPPTQTADNGASASVTATAAPGYSLASANGCGSGTLAANTYTTAAITADCAISVAFTATAVPVASVVVDSSANPALAGQAVTLTATVRGSGATPTGVVNFYDAGGYIGSASTALPAHAGAAPNTVLDAFGVATLTTATLSIGTHAISAIYLGDASYATATSNTLVEVVNAAPSAAPVSAPTLSASALYLLIVGTVLSGLIASRARHKSRV